MQRRAALKAVLLRRLVVTHLLPSENETLLHGRNAFLLFDAFFYAGDLRNELRQNSPSAYDVMKCG